MTEHKKPNLFNYATSELSQDAFICYLSEWAKPKNKEVDNLLHEIATEFVCKLLGKNLTIEKLKICRQWNSIDVLLFINEKYAVIVEDKKETKEHSNQLNRYFEIVKERFPNYKTIGIYYKMEEQGDYSGVEKAGYGRINRSDMKELLEKYQGGQNVIITDYYQKLLDLESSVNSYKTLKVGDWEKDSWVGFYTELQKEFNGSWQYVANPSGGFLGFHWGWRGVKLGDFFLQIEDNHGLMFKIYFHDDNLDNNQKRNLRDKLRHSLHSKKDNFRFEIKNTGRVGKSMSIAKIENFIIEKEDGTADIEKTFENIKKIEKLFDEVFNEVVN